MLPALTAWLNATVIGGHAIEFDRACSVVSSPRAACPVRAEAWLDTQRLAAALYPHRADHGLEAVAAALGVTTLHTAMRLPPDASWCGFSPLCWRTGSERFRRRGGLQRQAVLPAARR